MNAWIFHRRSISCFFAFLSYLTWTQTEKSLVPLIPNIKAIQSNVRGTELFAFKLLEKKLIYFFMKEIVIIKFEIA